MKIVWSPQARADLRKAILYVSQNNPDAAKTLRDRIKEAVTRLSTQPEIGRPGRVPNTRELVISDTAYTVPYQVRHGHIEILRVYHQARKWPEDFNA